MPISSQRKRKKKRRKKKKKKKKLINSLVFSIRHTLLLLKLLSPKEMLPPRRNRAL